MEKWNRQCEHGQLLACFARATQVWFAVKHFRHSDISKNAVQFPFKRHGRPRRVCTTNLVHVCEVPIAL